MVDVPDLAEIFALLVAGFAAGAYSYGAGVWSAWVAMLGLLVWLLIRYSRPGPNDPQRGR